LHDEDPPNSEWISYEDPDQGYVRVEFSAPMPSNKPEVEAPISNDSSLSEYCSFARVCHYMPQLEGFDVDFHVGIKQVDGSPFDGPRERFVLYADGALWQPKLLRWYLQLQKFDFVVRDKGDPK